MFTFLSLQNRSYADPLQSRKAASAWLGQLSSSDVLTRHQQVVDAFDTMRRTWTEIDRHRIAAIAYIDQSFEPEHRRLVQWYLENLEGSPRIAARFRQAAIEVNQSFLHAYQTALDPVCARADQPRWKRLIPLIFIRLVHCLGVDAKLKMLNHERWIPARWAELHQAFLRATELRVDRVVTTLEGANSFTDKRTVEQEYVYALLIDRLDTGNLSPSEIEWASARLRDWSSGLEVEMTPRNNGGFCVDLAGSRGLVRRAGISPDIKLGYLDTSLAIVQLDAAALALRAPELETDAERRAQAASHLATLDKLRPALLPIRNAELRRHARTVIDVNATVQVGFSDIASRLAAGAAAKTQAMSQRARGRLARNWQQALRYDANDACEVPKYLRSDDWIDAMPFLIGGEQAHTGLHFDESHAAIEHIEIPPVSAAPDIATQQALEHEHAESLAAPDAGRIEWRLKDRSVDGWRVFALAAASENVALHSLMAIKPEGAEDYTLTVVRRLHKQASHTEIGVAVIADRALAVTLYAARRRSEDMSVVVDGVDVANFGPLFFGLYVMPLAREETRRSMRTLIVPSSEYTEGRRLVLATGRSDYTIVLRQLIDRHADWSWASIQIADKRPRQG